MKAIFPSSICFQLIVDSLPFSPAVKLQVLNIQIMEAGEEYCPSQIISLLHLLKLVPNFQFYNIWDWSLIYVFWIHDLHLMIAITYNSLEAGHIYPRIISSTVLGLVPRSHFWFNWNWSQNQFFDRSGTYPYIFVLFVLGLIPDQILRSSGICPKGSIHNDWVQSQRLPAHDFGIDPNVQRGDNDKSWVHTWNVYSPYSINIGRRELKFFEDGAFW